MTSPGVVYVDETVDEYRHIRLPKNWTIHYEPEWGSLQASLQWCFNKYPDATHYGWLADDVRPRTDRWDKTLEAVAGDWCLSYARDLWLSENPHTLSELEQGCNLSSGLCWGGDLVRTVGWWALPGVRQAFIDVAWCRIIETFGLQRYTHDVVVEHLNYRTGKRERDPVDDWSRDGDDYIKRDIDEGYRWLASDAYFQVLRRLSVTPMRLVPSAVQIRKAVQQIRDDYANAHWTPGQSGSALTRVLADFDLSGRGAELAEILATHSDEGPPRVDPSMPRLGVGAVVH